MGAESWEWNPFDDPIDIRPHITTQRQLNHDIAQFMDHADGHDGPAEKCSRCQYFRQVIRTDELTLVESIADD